MTKYCFIFRITLTLIVLFASAQVCAKERYTVRIKVLKLGTVCQDNGTGLKGTLTHWSIDMGKSVNYLLQPKRLDEEGLPVKKLLVREERLVIKDSDFEYVDVPFEILGSDVTDQPSGFSGMAVEFIRHLNGCFHVLIQPKGINPKTKMPAQQCDFDLRSCTGKKIVKLSKLELAKSKKDTPSPTGDRFERKIHEGSSRH